MATALSVEEEVPQNVVEPVGAGRVPWRDGWDRAGSKASDVAVLTKRFQDLFVATEQAQEDRAQLIHHASNGEEAAERQMKRYIRDTLRRDGALRGADEEKVAQEIFDYLYGFRELAPLVHDDDVDEVQVNGPSNIWVIRSGRRVRTDVRLKDEQTLEQYLFPRLFAAKGQSLSREQPQLEHVRADGIRLTAARPPRGRHATMMIRKHNLKYLAPEAWVDSGSASTRMLDHLRYLVRGRVSILVSGPTGAGKTTVVRLLIGFSDPDMRWVSMAKDRELHLEEAFPDRGVVEFEVGGRGGLDDLFRLVLRYSPSAVVQEEIREGDEAEIMLLTVRRGHGGSLSTVHVTSPDKVALEVARMCLAGQAMDPTSLTLKWNEVAEAFPIVVHMAEDSAHSGRRMVEEIGQYEVHDPQEPPQYVPLCRWVPEDPLNYYAAGAWHWLNDTTDTIKAVAERHGVPRSLLTTPKGEKDAWAPQGGDSE